MGSNRIVNRKLGLYCLSSAICLLAFCSFVRAGWTPAKGPLLTRWAKDVTPDNAHREYPRPQMVRTSWQNLNGLWEYAIQPKDQAQPEKFDGQILVPFPVESALSGVMKAVGPDNRLWYRRTFEVPAKWSGRRILLHFGAVDWDATVWVNGKQVGSHKGGYDPFTFDITDALKGAGPQQIIVSVWDPTNTGTQPRGKQVLKPGGIWYTAVTGIWRTVWLEAVPKTYIESIRIVPDIDSESVRVVANCQGATPGCNVEVQAKDGWFTKAKAEGKPGEEIIFPIKKPKLWSPDSPFLYDLNITLNDGKGRKVDAVSSYFGMRKIEVRKDKAGINRLCLNNKPLFEFGPLDQGWWPDGLYTAPTDEALRNDIEVLKKLGCNMLRKHVKVEPVRFYYWCDKLGLMVWQDMPNGDKHIRGNQPDLKRSEESANEFERELTHVIEALHNHPCIVMWVPFNEGWGQYDTPRIVALIKRLDPTRLVDNASGWTDRGVGDVHDIHRYPGPAMPPTEEKRAAALGEFGGLGLPIKGHTWQKEKNWGYRTFKTRRELTDAYVALIENLRPLIGEGLCAAVYTQTSDVEVEVNGLMTYDRAMVKGDVKRMAAANKRLYLPPPVVKTIVPTSQQQPQSWRYRTSKPDGGWQRPDFDDAAWQEGEGGFGTEGTPGAVVRTEWKTSDIWLRRTFELSKEDMAHPQLVIHHDEDAEVYINGQLIAKLKGYTSSYVRVPISAKAANALKVGTSCIAIHCHQTTGGQYIDAGLANVTDQAKK
jgi:Glycosyl hydrolases family 2, sugar binding domain/Glycosyl hydrolases family 2/Glycosyl hydrolases family 2, TIM barrel domain